MSRMVKIEVGRWGEILDILKRKRGAKGDFKVWGLHNQRDGVKQLAIVTKNA